MPQIGPGGKFVFGWSQIRDDLTIKIPDVAVDEYQIAIEGKVILMPGSKKTGGFGVSRRELLNNSKLKCILDDNPMLNSYTVEEGKLVKYKNRLYCWLKIFENGSFKVNDEILKAFSIKKGCRLLAIRGSNLAVGMGVKGPLIELANNYKGTIKSY
ncbi:MAG: hypothetical protein ACFCUE_06170 [Candidatus Bathyarchaeia archaeon]|jgi:hypothetical protein